MLLIFFLDKCFLYEHLYNFEWENLQPKCHSITITIPYILGFFLLDLRGIFFIRSCLTTMITTWLYFIDHFNWKRCYLFYFTVENFKLQWMIFLWMWKIPGCMVWWLLWLFLGHFTPSLCANLAVVCDLWVCNPRMLFVGTHYLPPETWGRQPLHCPATGNTLLEGGATQNRKY